MYFIQSQRALKCFLLVFAIILILINSTNMVNASADNTIYELDALTSKPTEGNPSPNPLFGETTNNNYAITQNYDLLMEMYGNISSNQNNSVTILGKTLTTKKVEHIGLSLTLQKWDGSNWVDESKVYSYLESSSNAVSGRQEIIISKGYYYRVKSLHSAQDGKINESKALYSDYILIPQ